MLNFTTRGADILNTNTFDKVQYAGIAISTKGIAKVYGARLESFIPRQEIREICLKYGRAGERRWLQILFAIALLGWAAQRIFAIFLWLTDGGVMYIRMFVMPLPLLGVGGWLMWDLLRPQWHLEVQTAAKTHRLIFDGKVEKSMLSQYINAARQLGYWIDATPLLAEPF